MQLDRSGVQLGCSPVQLGCRAVAARCRMGAPALQAAIETARMALAPSLDFDQPHSFLLPSSSCAAGRQAWRGPRAARLSKPGAVRCGTVRCGVV